MTTIDLTIIDLEKTGTVGLRKLAKELGLKGMSSARGAELRAAIVPLQIQAVEAERVLRREQNQAVAAKSLCVVCSRRPRSTKAQRRAEGIGGSDFADICIPCYRESGWENTHSDAGHAEILAQPESERTIEEQDEIRGCWICFPELNEANADYVAKSGTSRQGQVVVAKGDKARIFSDAAEAAGFRTAFQRLDSGKTTVIVEKAENRIMLVWNGPAYDYALSGATLGGKSRKVRNLKEALRLLAA